MVEQEPSGNPFGEWLRVQRERRKLSQRELARVSGLSSSTVSRAEKRMPELSTAARLARSLRIIDEKIPL